MKIRNNRCWRFGLLPRLFALFASLLCPAVFAGDAPATEPVTIHVPVHNGRMHHLSSQVFALVTDEGAAALLLETPENRANKTGNGIRILNYR